MEIKELKHYYNAGTIESPKWVEIKGKVTIFADDSPDTIFEFKLPSSVKQEEPIQIKTKSPYGN